MTASIRIDFLSNIAEFNAGLRSGGQQLGSFQEQVQRLNRSFESAKSTAARGQSEQMAWIGAMRGGGPLGGLRNPMGVSAAELLGGMGADLGGAARRNEMRWKEMLPWGSTLRTTMTREAAESAAAIGQHSGRLAAMLTQAGSQLTALPGVGGILGGVGRFLTSPIGAGAALGAGGMMAIIQEVRHREQMAREVYRESLITGQSAADTSRFRAVGMDPMMISRFQRAMVADKGAFKTMGLSADKLEAMPVKDALLQVAGAMGNVHNAAQRSALAFQLFGRSGAEVLPILATMKERMDQLRDWQIIKPEEIQRVKAYDAAWRGTKGAMGDIKKETAETVTFGLAKPGAGLKTGIVRFFEQALNTISANPEAYVKAQQRYKKEDWRIDKAEDLERLRVAQEKLAESTKRYTAALADANAKMQTVADRAYAARYGEEAAEVRRFQRGLEKGGMPKDEAQRRADNYELALDRAGELAAREQRRIREKAEGERLAESVATPEEKFDKELKHADDLLAKRIINEDIYQRLARKYIEDYYRVAGNLDRKRIAEEMKSPVEKYRERAAWARRAAEGTEAGSFLTAGQAEFEQGQAKKEMLGKLGIKDLLGDYAREMKDLWQAFRLGEITPEQYKARRKELREGTARGLAGEEAREVSPVAAMERGGAQAYAVIAAAQINSPQIQLLQSQLITLDKIDVTLGIIKQQGQGAGRPEDL